MRISDWSSNVCSSDLLLLHVGVLDGDESTAHGLDAGELGARLVLQRRHLGGDHRGAVEDVLVLQQVRLEGEDLLQAQAPLLVPGPRQAERLVPRRELHGAGARALGERSEERRVGQEGVRTCRSRWSPYHSKKKNMKK